MGYMYAVIVTRMMHDAVYPVRVQQKNFCTVQLDYAAKADGRGDGSSPTVTVPHTYAPMMPRSLPSTAVTYICAEHTQGVKMSTRAINQLRLIKGGGWGGIEARCEHCVR